MSQARTTPPTRPTGQVEGVMYDWRIAAILGGLSPHQMLVALAELLGLEVAKMGMDVSHTQEMLTKLSGITRTACHARGEVMAGRAHAAPRVPGPFR